MAIIELRRITRTKPESTKLARYASNVTSQDGEDGIITRIFEVIGPTNKWCVEFGAWDGKYLSNTWNLINNEGWSAVLAEGNVERADHLSDRYQSSKVIVRNAFVGWEGDTALDAILAGTSIPADFDLLSVDIDGNDWHVWAALSGYRPRVVVIEFNPTASHELYFVQGRDAALNQGASLLAFVDLAKSKGYELISTTNVNALFVVREEFEKFGIVDNSLDAVHEPCSDIQICQGFDGTIFAAGLMSLIWHGVPLTQEDLQVLPRALRQYRDPGKPD